MRNLTEKGAIVRRGDTKAGNGVGECVRESGAQSGHNQQGSEDNGGKAQYIKHGIIRRNINTAR